MRIGGEIMFVFDFTDGGYSPYCLETRSNEEEEILKPTLALPPKIMNLFPVASKQEG